MVVGWDGGDRVGVRLVKDREKKAREMERKESEEVRRDGAGGRERE